MWVKDLLRSRSVLRGGRRHRTRVLTMLAGVIVKCIAQRHVARQEDCRVMTNSKKYGIRCCSLGGFGSLALGS
jgi:hypothetical protein